MYYHIPDCIDVWQCVVCLWLPNSFKNENCWVLGKVRIHKLILMSCSVRCLYGTMAASMFHDDVIKWKHFPRYWPCVRVNSPHKGQWREALQFSLICAWIKGWVNNREAGNLRRHRTHYDVTVMLTSEPYLGFCSHSCNTPYQQGPFNQHGLTTLLAWISNCIK